MNEPPPGPGSAREGVDATRGRRTPAPDAAAGTRVGGSGTPASDAPVTGATGARRVLVLNGVNLGRLGRREPGIYGSTTHAQLAAHLVDVGRALGLAVEVRQTDFEGEMVQWLHEAADDSLPVVLNPAAWTHYSIAVADAVAQVETLVEVHISNVHRREEFRHHSVVSRYATGTIVGLGLHGYELALQHVAQLQAERPGRTG